MYKMLNAWEEGGCLFPLFRIDDIKQANAEQQALPSQVYCCDDV